MSIPLLKFNHQITTTDIGAIALNRSSNHESDSNFMSSKRDAVGEKIKKILHSGARSKRTSNIMD